MNGVQPSIVSIREALPPLPPRPPVPLSWRAANRQANRERNARGRDWDWWDRRRRELAGWPEETPVRAANREAWVDALVTTSRGANTMALWELYRRHALARKVNVR